MAKILPFQRTGQLIAEIDEFLDKAVDAAMVTERAVLHYVESGADEELDERFERVMELEVRGDELRRSIANTMYAEMLMPDARGDMLNLLDEVDTILDDCVHLLANIAIQRPELPSEFGDGFREMMGEVSKSLETLLQGARAYFKEPHAVRDHVHRTSFHATEGTRIGVRVGREIYASALDLAHKRQLADLLVAIRNLASHADDVGDKLAIFAVKRSI